MSGPTPRNYVGLGLVCLVLGVGLALAAKTQAKVQESQQTARVSDESVAQFLAATQERDRLQQELIRLKEAASKQATVAQIQEELSLEEAAAGLSEVRGPGIVLVVSDKDDPEGTARQLLPRDVLLLLNELKAGGADAVAINGVRVTDRLVVTGGKGELFVNGLRAGGPIRVDAVGDPDLLVTSLNLRGGVVQQLSVWLDIAITKEEEVAVPPLTAPPAYEFAVPKR